MNEDEQTITISRNLAIQAMNLVADHALRSIDLCKPSLAECAEDVAKKLRKEISGES